MPNSWIKVTEIAASIFSTGYTQVFELYRVTAGVIYALVFDRIELDT